MEYRAWEIFQTPPDPPETVESAWQAAVAAGRYRPTDRAARAQFVAAWHAQQGDGFREEPDADEWEPVTEPPPRRGGADAGPRD